MSARVDDEGLRLEREQVRAASAPAEMVARDPDQGRSLTWHVGRYALSGVALVIYLDIAAAVFIKVL
jgi:hypothetical protein